ncbi:MAG: 3-phosphoshikimate 1-carboxyvinyltransferase [Clostridia bacterium]|nr:3-phosphoshikimate 1-carboxyvinyltransferase [Clostridia bacterium]
MKVEIIPGKLDGQISSIPSKSYAHRILICAALSGCKKPIFINQPSEDIQATQKALRILGGDKLADCGESGTTLRLLFPVAAALGLDVEFVGHGRLPQRPMEPMLTLLREHGCEIAGEHLPLKIKGMLKSGKYTLPGDISSQYISGLLLALPLLEGTSEISLTTPLESRGYVDMTLDTLNKFHIEILPTEQGWLVNGNQKYREPEDLSIEGDWSNSAFWLVANALGSQVNVAGLQEKTYQKDSQINKILRQKPTAIDVKDIPDLVPILAVWACGNKSTTVLENCGRLRLKESDRIASVCKMIDELGGKAKEKNDNIVIEGTGALRGGIVESENDHRIAMAAAIAATICQANVIIRGAEAVNKSYPNFFEDYRSLGGEVHVI